MKIAALAQRRRRQKLPLVHVDVDVFGPDGQRAIIITKEVDVSDLTKAKRAKARR